MSLDGWTPEDVFLIAECAYELYLEGKREQAAVIFEGLLAIDPTNVYCRDALTAISLSLGRPEDAVGHASQLLAQVPTHFDALARRCEAYLQLNRVDAAMRDLEALDRVRAESYRQRMTLRVQNANRLLKAHGDGNSRPAVPPLRQLQGLGTR
jgi:predicted Zn-dependent protease